MTQSIDPNAAASSVVTDYKSSKGMPFKVIAKNKKWNDDFWNGLVGPKLREDMDVETWIRGDVPAILDADGVHRTYDIKYIDFRPLGVAYAWPETQDHAEWGITKKNNWVVVGDINRMITQRKRGGGAIALQDPKLWNGLRLTEFVKMHPKGSPKSRPPRSSRARQTQSGREQQSRAGKLRTIDPYRFWSIPLKYNRGNVFVPLGDQLREPVFSVYVDRCRIAPVQRATARAATSNRRG